MTRACGPPETLREKKGLKQNSNGKPNNWGTNLSQSNPRLHDHSARRVPWKTEEICGNLSILVEPQTGTGAHRSLLTPIPAVGCPSRRLLVRVLSPQEQGLRKTADWQGDPPTQ